MNSYRVPKRPADSGSTPADPNFNSNFLHQKIKILVKNWAKTKQPYTCPHGRPVIYRMPKNDIDKHFNRTW